MAPHALMMFVWQAPYEGSARDIHWIAISMGVIAIAIALAGVVLAIVGIKAYIVVKRIELSIEDTKRKVEPVFSRGTQLFYDLSPKVHSITTNVEQISFAARARVDELGETISQINRTVADVNSRTRVQAQRVDGIVTEALNTTHEISVAIQNGIRVPVRQIAGVIAGVKAGLERLMERSPFAQRTRRPPENTGPYDL